MKARLYIREHELVGLAAQHALLAVSVGGTVSEPYHISGCMVLITNNLRDTVRRPYLLLYLKPHLLGAEGGAAPKEG